MSTTIELNNVGPIKQLSIPIPEDGGVVVLKGGNGSGKSHGVQAVGSLSSKESRKGLRNSDGMPSGSIAGLGVTVRLGRVNTAKGELLCESLEGNVDPSQLVDPGVKDPEKADAKRLVTLVRLAGIQIPKDVWIKAMVGTASITLSALMELVVDGDPIASADRIRRKFHAIALEKEKDSQRKIQEADSLLRSIQDVDLTLPCDESQLSSELEKATAAVAAAETKREQFIADSNALKIALEKIESLPESNLEVQLKELTEKGELLSKLQAELDEQTAVVRRLREDVEGTKLCIDRLQTHIDHARQVNAERDQFSSVIETVLPQNVDDVEYEVLCQLKSAAKSSYGLGETIRRAKMTSEQASILKGSSEQVAKEAEKIRTLARSTDAVLEQALIGAGFDEIKVADGRLCVESDRGLEPFSDLSHGERWRLALDLAAKGLPPGAVLPVCQEAFESLDPANRQEVNQLAKDRKLVIVTALATGGDLRAEVMEGGAV